MTSKVAARARRIGGIAALFLALGPAVIVTAPAAEAATAAVTASAAVTARYEARILALVNRERLSHGRHSLGLSACPERYAEGWAAYLARTNYFVHRNMQTYLYACKGSRVAENMGRGNVSADRMVAAWMASPGHRKNILNGLLTQIGVGAVYSRGQWTVVTDFRRA